MDVAKSPQSPKSCYKVSEMIDLDYDDLYDEEVHKESKDEVPRKWCTREDRMIKSDKARDKRHRLKERKAKQWERALHQ